MLKYTFIFFVIVGIMTKTNANSFTTEQQLSSRYVSEIADFWQQGKFAHFNGVKKISVLTMQPLVITTIAHNQSIIMRQFPIESASLLLLAAAKAI